MVGLRSVPSSGVDTGLFTPISSPVLLAQYPTGALSRSRPKRGNLTPAVISILGWFLRSEGQWSQWSADPKWSAPFLPSLPRLYRLIQSLLEREQR